MKIVLREKNKMQEVTDPKDFGGYFSYTADISPMNYLAPITPRGDYKFYKLFLNKFKEGLACERPKYLVKHKWRGFVKDR
jgi:hypothetical protein